MLTLVLVPWFIYIRSAADSNAEVRNAGRSDMGVRANEPMGKDDSPCLPFVEAI